MVIIADAQPSTGWTRVDRALALALTTLEAETCTNCGVPVWHAYSTDNTIQFEVEKSHCYACKKLEEDRADSEKSKKKKHGEVKTVKATTVFAEDTLPSRAKSYDYMAKEAAKEAQ